MRRVFETGLVVGFTLILHLFLGATKLHAQPHVVSVNPEQNELNVPVSTTIVVEWDVDLDTETLTNETFVVDGNSTGWHEGWFEPFPVLHHSIFVPNDPFEEGETVTVVLTSGIEDEDHNPLDPPFVWSFAVGVDDGSAIFNPHEVHPAGDGPRSVFAADLDGQDHLDLVAANYNDDDISVLLSDGQGGYQRQDYPVAGNALPYSVVAADLDRDGDLDLVTANYGGDDVSVLLNDGDGTFANHTDFPTGNGPLSLTAADLNGDGYFDLATANRWSNNVAVLMNDGNGGFPTHVDYSVDINTWSVTAADLDGDGDVDLVAISPNARIASVLLNTGDGTFGSPVDYDVGSSPKNVWAADLDGDGDIDLAVANNGSSSISVLLNNGDATFVPHVQYSVPFRPISVFAGDLDGDGDLDLTTAHNWADLNLSVLLNNGDATFEPYVAYTVGDSPYSVFAADLDGDGELDLTTANSNSGNISTLINKHDPHVFSTLPAQNELGVSPSSEMAVEFDGEMDGTTIDEQSFLVNARSTGPVAGGVTYDNGTRTATFAPTGDFEFEAGELVTVTLTREMASLDGIPLEDGYTWAFAVDAHGSASFIEHLDYEVADPAYSIIAADLDGDEDVDLACATSSGMGGGVSVLYWNGGGYDPYVVYEVGDSPQSVVAADLNGDSDLDLVTANSAANTVSVLLRDGAEYNRVDYPVADGIGPQAVFAADLDCDGDTDLATVNWITADISVLLNDGYGIFPPAVVYPTSWNPPSAIVAADLDGDGDIDLATVNVANEGSGDLDVHLNSGDGTFVLDGTYGVNEAPRAVLAADLNGDGDLDLVTIAHMGQTSYVEIYFNLGDGSFGDHVGYEVDGSPYSVFAADFDGDDDLDLATANDVPGPDEDFVTLLLNDGEGGFQAPYAVHLVGSDPRSIWATDLDGDGAVDLATANWFSNNVSVLLNRDLQAIFDERDPSSIARALPLSQNSPNPFNPTTVIRYRLPKACYVKLEIYNVCGQRVSTLVDEEQKPGHRAVCWNAGSLPSGVYLWRLQAGDHVETRTMTRIQ